MPEEDTRGKGDPRVKPGDDTIVSGDDTIVSGNDNRGRLGTSLCDLQWRGDGLNQAKNTTQCM